MKTLRADMINEQIGDLSENVKQKYFLASRLLWPVNGKITLKTKIFFEKPKYKL